MRLWIVKKLSIEARFGQFFFQIEQNLAVKFLRSLRLYSKQESNLKGQPKKVRLRKIWI